MFKNELLLEDIEQSDLWALAAPLTYTTAARETITVPKGFITDLASIPHFIDWIPFLDRTGASRRPGAFHDWLYAGMRAKGKDWADNLLREALMSEGMPEWQANIYWRAVHYCGASSYAFDAQRHPYATNPSNLESFDFIREADWQAWLATGPEPNEKAA